MDKKEHDAEVKTVVATILERDGNQLDERLLLGDLPQAEHDELTAQLDLIAARNFTQPVS